MKIHVGRTTTWLALVAAIALAVTACGGSDTAGSTTSPSSVATPSSDSAAPSASESGTAVVVTETEFAIEMPSTALAAGTYTFKVSNKGKFPHDLTIEGPGVDKQATAKLEPGASGDVTVTLQAGTYEFWCSVGKHKDKGMDMEITVT